MAELFNVTIEHKPRNFVCNALITATTSDHAIQLLKNRMIEALRSFFKRYDFGDPQEFWKDCEFCAIQQVQFKVLNFTWDRLSDDEPVHILPFAVESELLNQTSPK